ncbi:MAG TPA: 5'/3'-nucleotidase SurE, partial [Candidatus Bathyarchaeia archaeon]|nr:5'/3'-nucleotidase SurE [Candidatus Bathyarchaeia archaeon]
PHHERSSISHSITLTQPIWKSAVERNGKFFGISLTGTPADCVKYASYYLLKDTPDLVVSGINPGPNDAASVFYSGTIGGAREGALIGAQAIALSVNAFQDVRFDAAVWYGIKIAKFILRHPLPKGTFLNVNIPHKPRQAIKGIKMTRQGPGSIRTRFTERINPYGTPYLWMSGIMPRKRKEVVSDTDAVLHDFVAVTPLHCDQTDSTALELLKKENLDF